MYLYNFRSFFIIPLIVVSAHAQNFVTNGAGSLVLNNSNFVGTSTQSAGDIRNFDSFETVDVSYQGYVSSASATDASGGVHTEHPILRRCGVGIAHLSESLELIFAAGCRLPGTVQSVPRAELY